MSDYDIRPGGSLKLKGGVAEGGVVKKKKKSKSKAKQDNDAERERKRVRELLMKDEEEETKTGSPSGSGRDSPAVGGPKKTDAERRFEEVQKRRLAERVAKLAGKTHKDRVAEFNNHLESLSEHHDIPKVGPG